MNKNHSDIKNGIIALLKGEEEDAYIDVVMNGSADILFALSLSIFKSIADFTHETSPLPMDAIYELYIDQLLDQLDATSFSNMFPDFEKKELLNNEFDTITEELLKK